MTQEQQEKLNPKPIALDQLPRLLSMIQQEQAIMKKMMTELGEKFSNKQAEQKSDLMTIQQASEFLFLTVPTIYNKVHRNELPYMKRGKRLYFSRAELHEYLKAGKNQTNDELIEEVEIYLESKKKGGQK